MTSSSFLSEALERQAKALERQAAIQVRHRLGGPAKLSRQKLETRHGRRAIHKLQVTSTLKQHRIVWRF